MLERVQLLDLPPDMTKEEIKECMTSGLVVVDLYRRVRLQMSYPSTIGMCPTALIHFDKFNLVLRKNPQGHTILMLCTALLASDVKNMF